MECICNYFGSFLCVNLTDCKHLNCTSKNFKSFNCCVELKCQDNKKDSQEINLENNKNFESTENLLQKSSKTKIIICVCVVIIFIIIILIYSFRKSDQFNHIKRCRTGKFNNYVRYVRV